MADITKCEGKDCPVKKTCYRFTATGNEFRQAWFTETPGKKVKGKFECEHYWETRRPITSSEK